MATSTARLGAAAAVVSLLASLSACDAPAPSSAPGSAPLPTASGPAQPTFAPLTPEPTVSASPTDTPTAAPSAAPSDPTAGRLEWQSMAGFPADGAIEVASVAAWQDGYIAAGWEPAPGEDIFGRRQGVIWRTPDGRRWERSADAAFANATLLHIVPAGGTLYVFGFLSVCPLLLEGCEDVPDAGIAVWRSTDADGTAWERIPQPREMRESLLDGVTTVGDGLVAYGSSGTDLRAAMWLSDDGRDWRPIDDLAGMDPVSAVAAGDRGFVAFGSTYEVESDTTRAVAAVSEDGETLSPAAIDRELGGIVEDITHSDGRYVAAGTIEDFEFGQLSAAVLTSDDGTTWTSVDTGTTFAGFGVHAVHAIPGGYVAIGYARIGATGEREQARTWQSADGITWQRTGTLTGVYREFKASAVGTPGVIAFAIEYEDEFDEAADSVIRVWFAPLPPGGTE